MTYRSDWSDADGVIIGYMDKVDFDHEVGCAKGGNKIYPSIKNLLEDKKCVGQCGVVEVEVRLKRVILESQFRITNEESKERIRKLMETNFIPVEKTKES